MPRPKLKSDDEVLEAATVVLKRCGPIEFTLSGVAKEVGLSRAALIQRFTNRDTLLVRMMERVEDPQATAPSAPAAAELLLHSVIAGATMQWAVDPDGELADHVLAQIAAILCLMFPEHDDFQLLQAHA
ncbi:TetR family transcriptional regulator [Escherichia coli]|uniref:TetR family transcriptional regulator n=1 Tax=Escherichia coli TaxID=562 RepID=UPI001CD01E25|nr:TetR family transcriptional regulator [Escherichia coli]UBM04008.1 TetR/AcrR family transcriptional regulator [Escherichia coli]